MSQQRKPLCGRLRIGSFFAASNVTGMISPVPTSRVCCIATAPALACFDFAAGPYVSSDMNPPPGPDGGDSSLDAVFISPYVIDAVDFVGQHGHLFTSLYAFDLRSDTWIHERDPGMQERFP